MANPSAAGGYPLAERAIELLTKAANIQPDNPDLFVEERAVWQPDSWLLQRCWQVLAEHGEGEGALAVAALLELRNPLAPVQALYRVAAQTPIYQELKPLVARELKQLRLKLFSPWVVSDDARQTERLLLAGASAAIIGDAPFAFACLERLDQIVRSWDRIFASTELRDILAATVARIGLHPLTTQLIVAAIRRYEDAGAIFLHQVLETIGPQLALRSASKPVAKLAQRCVDTFRYATLTTLNGRRLAAIAFGRLGYIKDLLEQIATIANVQDARRQAGLSSGKGDPHFLRQVKRPAANPDVDFQVYALQEAVRAMPIREIAREDRITLADRLALLAVQSDGWTAAGASATLVDLGALKYAVDVVDHIPPNDPTRSEGVISLVRRLLLYSEGKLAEEQVRKALAWLRSISTRNPERATIWGLAEVYLEYNQPEMALRLLDHRYEREKEPRSGGNGLADRVRRMLGSPRPIGSRDDELRDNRLRLHALIRFQGGWSPTLQAMFDQLLIWAPRLLDGEALIGFYVDGLLRPLLSIGKHDLIWKMLPQVREALAESSGDKHAVQITRVARLLGEFTVPRAVAAQAPVRAKAVGATNGNGIDHAAESVTVRREVSHEVGHEVRQEETNDDPEHAPDSGNGMSPQGIAAHEPAMNGHTPDLENVDSNRDIDGDKDDDADSDIDGDADTDGGASITEQAEEARAHLETFLLELWQADAEKGIWQMIHSVEGSLPLVLALAGPQSLVTIAQATANDGGLWS